MDISKIEPGNKDVVNVFIECVKGTKDFYGYDKKTETFILKRVLEIPFPDGYGFIPKTHHIDAEPLDVLVLISNQLQQGVVLPARPIGVIRLKGNVPDDVLIAVSISDKSFESINDISQVENLDELKRFLEIFKESTVEYVFDAEHAKKSIETSINLYKKEFE
jgi:inorganic pyrophosphatase